jgi:hypothetical protein
MSESQKARSGRWYLHRKREIGSLEIVPVALVECDAKWTPLQENSFSCCQMAKTYQSLPFTL